jgi:adenine-specific DNA-methyltransferase
MHVDESRKEKYELTWAGKAEAKRAANGELYGKTLKYIASDSKDPENTENVYIEGDNLEVLKLLRHSYYNKIKMIYIDPPYNTGHDFVYRDKFAMGVNLNAKLEGEADEEGRRLIVNQRSGGRFHSDWLNMMYPRLKVAREVLAEDGVIFISIDDNEFANLRLICDEIFREENLLGVLARKTKLTSNKGTYFAPSHEYILAYAKNIDEVEMFNDPEAQEDEHYIKLFKHEDQAGKYNLVSLYMPSLDMRPNQRYYIECPDGSCVIPPDGKVFRWTRETFERNLSEDRVVFKRSDTSPLLDEQGNRARWNIYTKLYLHERREKGLRPVTLVDKHPNSAASKELIRLGIPFPFSKPKELIMYLMKISGTAEGYVLDFFSGSAATAHAVMQLNAEDGGKRKFIMVQIPEPCNEKSDAAKAGYANLCELGKERIRRAGDSIEGLFPHESDIGFKVFRVADTNLRWLNDETVLCALQTSAAPSSLDRFDFFPDATDLDIVYELLLRHRNIPLSSRLETLAGVGERTYVVSDRLVISLEEEITERTIEAIAAIGPPAAKIILRDSAFGCDIARKANALMRLEGRSIEFI